MSQLAMVGIRLILMLFVSEAAVLVGTRIIYTGEVQDPLAPYAAIMPGQPVENLEQYSCNWYAQYYEDGTRGGCRTTWEDDPSSSVSVSVDQLTIESLTFDVSGFTVGDLTRLWGRPVIGNYRGLYSVRWYRAGCVISAPLSRRFSYRRPVRYFFVVIDPASIS